MPYLYTGKDGVNRQLKVLGGSVGGVGRKLNNLWAYHNGANRKIFSGYAGTVTVLNSIRATLQSIDDNGDIVTLFSNTTHDLKGGSISLLYTFNEPIYIPRFSSITANYAYVGVIVIVNAYGYLTGQTDEEYFGWDESTGTISIPIQLAHDVYCEKFHIDIGVTLHSKESCSIRIKNLSINGTMLSNFELV